jgi:hypothetical protein
MQPGSGDARPPAPATGPGPYALYHFATSGASVAAATAVTHPLGKLLLLLPSSDTSHLLSKLLTLVALSIFEKQ